MRRTLVSVVLAAVLLSSVACVANPPPPQRASDTDTPAGVATATLPVTLAGKTVRVSYDSGTALTLAFAADGASVVRSGTDRPIATAPATVTALDPGVFLVTWAEADGIASQVQDFRTGTVHGTWAHRPDPAAPFTIETRTGTVRLAD
ncbi:MoaF-related domain-containing protein [Nocardia otitidiscaviarum]|uniref:MoaF-related domain-containing protein n=1 Tax=Nocardia otitidiscaviarum TaxID=1823 RepID=UPI0011C046FC|nr:MoaF N-terminal domain-containing protein [Nocardia otitidiscaviarum]